MRPTSGSTPGGARVGADVQYAGRSPPDRTPKPPLTASARSLHPNGGWAPRWLGLGRRTDRPPSPPGARPPPRHARYIASIHRRGLTSAYYVSAAPEVPVLGTAVREVSWRVARTSSSSPYSACCTRRRCT